MYQKFNIKNLILNWHCIYKQCLFFSKIYSPFSNNLVWFNNNFEKNAIGLAHSSLSIFLSLSLSLLPPLLSASPSPTHVSLFIVLSFSHTSLYFSLSVALSFSLSISHPCLSIYLFSLSLSRSCLSFYRSLSHTWLSFSHSCLSFYLYLSDSLCLFLLHLSFSSFPVPLLLPPYLSFYLSRTLVSLAIL